jgi:hypothetical protein
MFRSTQVSAVQLVVPGYGRCEGIHVADHTSAIQAHSRVTMEYMTAHVHLGPRLMMIMCHHCLQLALYMQCPGCCCGCAGPGMCTYGADGSQNMDVYMVTGGMCGGHCKPCVTTYC